MDNNNEEIRDELDDLSPLLGKLRKPDKTPFSTPPQYFSQLEDSIWKKIQSETAPKTEPQSVLQPVVPSFGARLWQWLFRPSYAWGIAGIVGILVVMNIILPESTRQQPTDYTNLVAQISDDELHDYISENDTDFDAEVLMENIQTADIADIPSVTEVLLPMDTIVPPTPNITANTNKEEPQPNTTTTEVSAEKLLEGITADDILEFMDDEGLLDDLLDEQ